MIINRQNYQIWITDYYDGQLDDFQTEVLMDFLGKNPDLMSEFEDYPGLYLKAEDQHAYDNTDLLRTPDELTNEQVEHYAIALTENDLTENQKAEVNELKKSDPRFRESINIYEKIKLKPDNIIYPDKSLLLAIPGRRRIIRIVINSVSVAASIAIITGLFFIFNRSGNEYINPVLAEETQTDTETEQVIKEKTPRINPKAETPAQIPENNKAIIAEQLSASEIIEAETLPVQQREFINITPLAFKENIRLDQTHTQYLLADVKPYPVMLSGDTISITDMSVREFLAYHFRKQLLKDDNPDIENLKAWEIADAGIKGVNMLLGWQMDLQTEKNEEGKLENISFTSELIKFDHQYKKNNADL